MKKKIYKRDNKPKSESIPDKDKLPANSKWKDIYILQAYELAREGLSEPAIARTLGISKDTFYNWEVWYPLFKEAIERGRAYVRATGTDLEDFRDDIYRELAPEERETWRKLHELNMLRSDKKKVDLLLRGRGREFRQKMWLCALLKCRFNKSAACRMTGISYGTVAEWKHKDKRFWQLIGAIEAKERDWAESCLRRTVEMHDVQAIKLFLQANYKEKYGNVDRLGVDVSGQIDHKHQHTLVSIDDLDLPLPVMKMILNKMREKRKLVESTVVEDGGQQAA